jgi:hypothetical protein
MYGILTQKSFYDYLIFQFQNFKREKIDYQALSIMRGPFNHLNRMNKRANMKIIEVEKMSYNNVVLYFDAES